MANCLPSALKASEFALRFSTTFTNGARLGKAYMYRRVPSCAARNAPSGLVPNALPGAVFTVAPVEAAEDTTVPPKSPGSAAAMWARPSGLAAVPSGHAAVRRGQAVGGK